jgi:SAM-dependent methyltransferase
MGEARSYFAYLQSRSRLAWLYRRHWLYPRLCRHLRGRVLDVGCGIGDMLRFRQCTVGVDINQEVVSWCRAQGLDARVMAPDRLPFADDQFDGVILDNVLEHLSRPESLLREIRRVLARGGTFVVGVPGRRGYDSDPDHKVFYSETELVRVIEKVGLGKECVLHMPLKSAWLDRHMRPYCIYGVFRRD